MTSIFPDGELDNAVELGAFDERSVRVWVRFTGRKSVDAILRTPGQPDVVKTIPLSESSDWTGVLVLERDRPAPGSPFTVTIDEQHVHGRFAPSPGEPAALTFGFGSCHMPYAEDDAVGIVVRESDAAIYPAIQHDLMRAGADLLLLAGDQVYSDGLDSFSVRERPVTDDDDILLGQYRSNYRGFYNQTGMRQLREAFPTVSIWDDHDIFDNWGSTSEKTPYDLRLFNAACRAYGEYQHSRNPGDHRDKPPFHWATRWGDIGIVALDLRGARDYERGTMLGAEQWAWLQAWFRGEEAQSVSTVFVVSSVPVAHTARWFTLGFDLVPKRFAESIRDRWSSSGFIDSRDALLDELFSWQSRKSTRQVFILSGDVHCASAFTIRQRTGDGVIHQVTSSAFTTPLPLKQRVFNRTVVHGSNLFERNYRFQNHFLSLTHNYGGVRVEPVDSGGHRVIVAIRAWDPKRRALRTAHRMVVQADARVRAD